MRRLWLAFALTATILSAVRISDAAPPSGVVYGRFTNVYHVNGIDSATNIKLVGQMRFGGLTYLGLVQGVMVRDDVGNGYFPFTLRGTNPLTAGTIIMDCTWQGYVSAAETAVANVFKFFTSCRGQIDGGPPEVRSMLWTLTAAFDPTQKITCRRAPCTAQGTIAGVYRFTS
jgi:hypothetical protein